MISPPRGLEEIKKVYGDIVVSKLDGKRVIISPRYWEDRNMLVVRDLPGFEGRPLYINRLIEQPLRAALTGATIRRPDYKIRTLGCFNPRQKRTNGAELSLHSWGVAVDLNADANPLVRLKHETDTFECDIPNEWIEEFKRCGFTWGGEFRGLTKDPQHFQWASAY